MGKRNTTKRRHNFKDIQGLPIAVAPRTPNEGRASVAMQKDINFIFHSECQQFQTGIKQLNI